MGEILQVPSLLILLVCALLVPESEAITDPLTNRTKLWTDHDGNQVRLLWQPSTKAWCQPVFPAECQGQGFEIQPCLKDGTKDVCIQCKAGYRQERTDVNSFDIGMSLCYQHSCLSAYSVPYHTKLVGCPYEDACVCNQHECSYSSGCPGGCWSNKERVCGVNEEPSNTTGDCQECPWYTYKGYEGCGVCQPNRTLFEAGPPPKAIPPARPSAKVTARNETAAEIHITKGDNPTDCFIIADVDVMSHDECNVPLAWPSDTAVYIYRTEPGQCHNFSVFAKFGKLASGAFLLENVCTLTAQISTHSPTTTTTISPVDVPKSESDHNHTIELVIGVAIASICVLCVLVCIIGKLLRRHTNSWQHFSNRLRELWAWANKHIDNRQHPPTETDILLGSGTPSGSNNGHLPAFYRRPSGEDSLVMFSTDHRSEQPPSAGALTETAQDHVHVEDETQLLKIQSENFVDPRRGNDISSNSISTNTADNVSPNRDRGRVTTVTGTQTLGIPDTQKYGQGQSGTVHVPQQRDDPEEIEECSLQEIEKWNTKPEGDLSEETEPKTIDSDDQESTADEPNVTFPSETREGSKGKPMAYVSPIRCPAPPSPPMSELHHIFGTDANMHNEHPSLSSLTMPGQSLHTSSLDEESCGHGVEPFFTDYRADVRTHDQVQRDTAVNRLHITDGLPSDTACVLTNVDHGQHPVKTEVENTPTENTEVRLSPHAELGSNSLMEHTSSHEDSNFNTSPRSASIHQDSDSRFSSVPINDRTSTAGASGGAGFMGTAPVHNGSVVPVLQEGSHPEDLEDVSEETH